MESSRRHKNFMMIKNKMWEALYKKPLFMQERQVWDYIYRQTKGWGCDMREISTYELSKELRINPRCVRRVIGALLEKRRIVVKGKLKGIQEDFTLWKVGHTSPTKEVGHPSPNSRTHKSALLGPTSPLIKDTLLKTKETSGVLYKKLSGKEIDKLEKIDWFRAIMYNNGKFPEDYIEDLIGKYKFNELMNCWYIFVEAENIHNNIGFFNSLLEKYQEDNKK